MFRPLLRFGGGSVEILRGVLLDCVCRDAETKTLIVCTKAGDESGHVGMALQTPDALDGLEHAHGDPGGARILGVEARGEVGEQAGGDLCAFRPR